MLPPTLTSLIIEITAQEGLSPDSTLEEDTSAGQALSQMGQDLLALVRANPDQFGAPGAADSDSCVQVVFQVAEGSSAPSIVIEFLNYYLQGEGCYQYLEIDLVKEYVNAKLSDTPSLAVKFVREDDQSGFIRVGETVFSW